MYGAEGSLMIIPMEICFSDAHEAAEKTKSARSAGITFLKELFT